MPYTLFALLHCHTRFLALACLDGLSTLRRPKGYKATKQCSTSRSRPWLTNTDTCAYSPGRRHTRTARGHARHRIPSSLQTPQTTHHTAQHSKLCQPCVHKHDMTRVRSAKHVWPCRTEHSTEAETRGRGHAVQRYALHGPSVCVCVCVCVHVCVCVCVSAHSLVRLLALSLSLPAHHFDPSFTHPMVFLRPLYYHAVTSQPEEGVFGAGAHTDWGMLTFLKTDDVPGLQIHVDGKWIDVPPK